MVTSTPQQSLITESSVLPLIRCYCDAGDVKSAINLISQMKIIGINPRLRSYQPILYTYFQRGNVEEALNILQDMLDDNVYLQSEQVTYLIETLDKLGKPHNENESKKIDQILERTSNSILGLAFDDISKIVALHSNNTKSLDSILEEGIEVESEEEIIRLQQPDLDLIKLQARNLNTDNNNVDNEIGNDDTDDEIIIPSSSSDNVRTFKEKYYIKSGAIGVNPQRTKIVEISHESCRCPNCGDKLRLLYLTENERLLVRVALMKISSMVSVEQWRNLQVFAEWLKSQEEFVYIVDGANVAYHNQNYKGGKFSFKQLEFLVNKLKERGERILVLLSASYTTRVVPNSIRLKGNKRHNIISEEDEKIIQKLQDEGMLYKVPSGDDDWYWMYSTVNEGRSKPAFVLTNDGMSDHKVAFMEPRPFLRWRMAHVIGFDFIEDVRGNGNISLVFRDPIKFSREIQRTYSGRWHFPSTDKKAWMCTNISHVSNPS